MRACEMTHRNSRKIEIRVVVRQAGQAARSDRDAVIPAVASEELLFFRTTQRIVHEPDHLHYSIVRLGTGVGEENPGQWLWRHLHNLFSQADRRRMRLVREGMI